MLQGTASRFSAYIMLLSDTTRANENQITCSRVLDAPLLVCYNVGDIRLFYFRGGMEMMPDPLQPLARIQANMVIRNIGQLVTVAQQPVPGASGPLQVIDNAAVALHDGVIVWLGRDDESEPMFQHDAGNSVGEIATIDAQG